MGGQNSIEIESAEETIVEIYPAAHIFFDRRRDDATAVEVERAVFLKKCFGIKYGGAYLLSRKISLEVAIRVIVEERGRVNGTYYMPTPRHKVWNQMTVKDRRH